MEVWQRAVDLVVAIYEVGKNLPREEKYGIISQMQRAAASVPANIAEGWARGKTGEYVQFLRVWRGSLMELETHVIIAQRLNFICNNDLLNLQQEIERIARMLNRLISSLSKPKTE